MNAAYVSTGAGVKVEHLTYRLPMGTDLIKGIDFELEPGDRLAIVGPNGAGKSTLLRMLAGLLSPSSGRYLLNGTNRLLMSDLQLAREVAFLPQQLMADKRLTVSDFVRLGCLPYARQWSAERQDTQVANCIALCRLSGLKDRPLEKLSGGELQRTHLARSLAQEPALLLLDEPTNHLDPRAGIELLSTVASLEFTCIAVLHDLSFVPHWATHVLVMRSGAMVSFGEPAATLTAQRIEQVFSTPAFYLPHPSSRTPMLVIDRSRSGPARPSVSFA